MLFFKFAGIFPGCIVLRGELERCGSDERAAVEKKYETPRPGLSSETIKVRGLKATMRLHLSRGKSGSIQREWS